MGDDCITIFQEQENFSGKETAELLYLLKEHTVTRTNGLK